MAKMLKRFGIGGKKGPPNPPKPDYSNQKSSSVQDLCGKFPTSDRKRRSHTLSSSSSNIHSHHSFELSDSPRHSRSLKGNGLSRAASDKHPNITTVVPELSTTEDKTSGGNPTPPRLLDDYSDPFDLKKQIKENPELIRSLGKPSNEEDSDIQDVSDDDYSVPYEIKKLNREKNQEKAEREKTERAKQEKERNGNIKSAVGENSEEKSEPVEEKNSAVPNSSEQNNTTHLKENSVEAKTTKPIGENELKPPEEKETESSSEEANAMQRQQEELGAAGGIQLPTGTDPRPQQEYEQPWDWSKTSSILFAAGDSNGANLSPEKDLRNAHSPEEHDTEYENTKHDYVNAQIGVVAKPVPGQVEDRLANCHVSQDGEAARNVGYGGARPKEKCSHVTQKMKQHRGPADDKRIGNYEEPWDLSNTQNILEEAFLANKIQLPAGESTSSSKDNALPTSHDVTGNGVERHHVQNEENPPVTTEPMMIQAPDTRPQEGYEKPWDWKPHKKDDREQEGYEKPWDWKPHQKDQRPMEEYDQPWDQRAKNIEQNIVKAKSAKEIKGCASTSKESPGSQQTSQGVERNFDTRPMDEYDTPWDQKMAASIAAAAAGKMPVSRTVSDSSQVAQHSSVLHSTKSPAKRHQSQPLQPKVNIDPGWSPVGERIDPKVPLDKQGWYHGAISRVDAERLLRIHKEGSFLVRMSESNKRDFSLSLKSARGFMHMKIVYKGGNFILGQFSQPFESIPKMIYHYSLNKLPIKGAEHMSLLHPVHNELL